MLLAEYAPSQLVCFCAPLATVGRKISSDTASGGIWVGIGVGVVGCFINVLGQCQHCRSKHGSSCGCAGRAATVRAKRNSFTYHVVAVARDRLWRVSH